MEIFGFNELTFELVDENPCTNDHHLFVCLFVCLFIHLFACLFVYLLAYLFVDLFIHLFICLFVCLFVCLKEHGFLLLTGSLKPKGDFVIF